LVNDSNKICIVDTNFSFTEGQIDSTSSSDSTKIENFIEVDKEEILKEMGKLSLSSMHHENLDSSTSRHYRSIVQDFFNAIRDGGISTIVDDTGLYNSDVNLINMIAKEALENRITEPKTSTDELKELRLTVKQLIDTINIQKKQILDLENKMEELNVIKTKMDQMELLLDQILLSENAKKQPSISIKH
jgi:hypothetical protein